MSARKLLIVAYHFPPLAGSSGIQRALRLVQQLPDFGWQPLVLSADPRAFERTSQDQLQDIPAGTVVERAFALDAARHLALGGRYFAWTARPDRWISWRFDAVRRGMKLIRKYRPDAIWSTYPIATAHLIAAELQRRSGLPWLADFRDPMLQEGYPADPVTWRQFKRIEEQTFAHASRTVFTTPGAARYYTARYPGLQDRMRVVENGYDEESFAAAEATLPAVRAPLRSQGMTLLHSGVVYPYERDPTQLMAALRLLLDRGSLWPGRLCIRFRASGHDGLIRALAERHGVSQFIELLPPMGYRDALSEMLCADALLVMQAANCNDQVPAKVYEYLRSHRPVLALTDPAGDTARVLSSSGIQAIAPLDDSAAIAALLDEVMAGRRSDMLATAPAIRAASRKGRTAALVAELDTLTRRQAGNGMPAAGET